MIVTEKQAIFDLGKEGILFLHQNRLDKLHIDYVKEIEKLHIDHEEKIKELKIELVNAIRVFHDNVFGNSDDRN